jgi:two-component system response regulator HydG
MSGQSGRKGHILIVDDNPANLATIEAYLAVQGFATQKAKNGPEALEKVAASPPEVILLDLLMHGMDGFEVSRRLKSNPCTFKIPIIAVTSLRDRVSNLKAIEAGMDGFLTKPIDEVMLKAHLESILKMNRLSNELETSRRRLDTFEEYHRRVRPDPYRSGEIVGAGDSMREVLARIKMVKDLDVPVLILGESGTGKQLVAEAIHWASVRATEPFVQVNCANLHENLLESELFGHERGAFTGAVSRKKGLIEVAEGGTLFVDEIGDMPALTQAKLLVVLDSGRFRRLGETAERNANVRIVAATNRDLEKEMEEGRFRSDLFYRINVIKIHIPPLRERKEDIPLLAEYFLSHSKLAINTRKYFSQNAMNALQSYNWPGNVRELSNVVDRAVVFSGDEDVIDLKQLPKEVIRFAAATHQSPPVRPHHRGLDPAVPLKKLSEMEMDHIKEALGWAKGNRTHAARILGISRSTLKKKIVENPSLQEL